MTGGVGVLHVITRLTLGGSAENVIATVVDLNRRGYTCGLATSLAESEPDVVEDARRRGVEVVDIPALGREVRPVRDLAALGQLWRLVRRRRPAIVHTHTSKAGFLGRLAARLARAPAIIHQPHGHVFYGYWGPSRTALYTALERLAARWTDRIITLTERGVEEHLARGIGRPEQFAWVPSGVDLDALRAAAPTRDVARRHLGLGPDAFVVAACGRFVPIKGFDLLVEALPHVVAAVPTARLVLIGDGPERSALETLAASRGVGDRIIVTGAVRDVAAPLAAADVVAVPSRNEGMGRAIVEAMALGLPVVGAAVGGIPAVIVDGECGRLVPPEDPPALAAALVGLGRDPELRARLGTAAVKRAARFSTAVANERMAAVYDALVGEKHLA